MSTMAKEVNLIATFRAQPGCAEKVKALIVDYGNFVRQEPGNVFFHVYSDSENVQDFVIIERYVDQSGFDTHLSTAEGKNFNQALTPLIEGTGSQLQFLTRLS